MTGAALILVWLVLAAVGYLILFGVIRAAILSADRQRQFQERKREVAAAESQRLAAAVEAKRHQP